jgi:hypothetical protein
MNKLVIEDKKYVLLPQDKFDELQKKAALKWKPGKTFTISGAREFSKKRINEWSSEK